MLALLQLEKSIIPEVRSPQGWCLEGVLGWHLLRVSANIAVSNSLNIQVQIISGISEILLRTDCCFLKTHEEPNRLPHTYAWTISVRYWSLRNALKLSDSGCMSGCDGMSCQHCYCCACKLQQIITEPCHLSYDSRQKKQKKMTICVCERIIKYLIWYFIKINRI